MLPRSICQCIPPPTLVLKVSVDKGQEMKPGDNAAQGNILEIIHTEKKQTPKGAMPSKRENQKRPPYAKKQETCKAQP